ncbi:NuA4-domain-containing protein [Ascodesmis nigricans]|uniref:Chromatin modification-related protein EAF6 n=1 Tax=Ascodesmis nigricans TaxID=341454 RepID=A0A4S2MYM4_9PEZI|nr:NuA4-domain-containing protein [Ascodesmis nigricans]
MPEPMANSASPSKAPTPNLIANREAAMAYYEKMRKQLRDLIQQKRHQEKQLALYEDNIFKAETAYLEETQNGNIVKGFDNYIKGNITRRKTNINESDRVFSLSSLSFASKDDLTSTTTTSTPTVLETPRLSAQVSKNKKSSKRRKDNEESESVSEVETPGPKRVRISFSGQPTAN